MKYLPIFFFFLFLNHFLFAQTKPARLDRAHSFFGIHFDFHAGADCHEIGKRVTRQMVSEIIDQIHPDFIQIDCKGHPGYSSYPTRVGNAAPGFVGNPLKIWREITAEKGIALYMHYSGVYDMRAVEQHPSWAVVNSDGKPSTQYTSVFGPYADSLMIPQFKELSSIYGIDGIWVDGDCWATQIDYTPGAKKAFTQKTGISQIPLKPTDPFWKEYLSFNRQAFRNYLNHYVTVLHDYNPNLQIASNWAYSSFMPEAASIPVDFISGDFSATNSLNSARFEGRFIRNQGKPWDLMSWGFSWIYNQSGTMSIKTPLQIERELAEVLALGGGVQVYMRQQRDGSVYRWTLPVLAEVAAFVRARQPWCQYAKGVPQIGLINSTDIFYSKVNKPFTIYEGNYIPLYGNLQNLIASQQVVDVVAEHQLAGIDQYPLLIYPEYDSITPKLKAKLLSYVSKGGHLLLIGPKTAALFKEELQITLHGHPEIRTNVIEHNQVLEEIYSLSQSITCNKGAKPFGKYYLSWDNETPSETAASISQYGKGKIGAIYMNMGQVYMDRFVPVTRDFLQSVVKELFTDPIVEVSGSHLVDVTANQLNNKLVIHLINAAGPHDNEKILVHDEIPPIENLLVNIRYSSKPAKVTIQPSGKPLSFKYDKGMIQCRINKVAIHEMIVVE